MIIILAILAIVLLFLYLDNSGKLLGLIISMIFTLLVTALGTALFIVLVDIGVNL